MTTLSKFKLIAAGLVGLVVLAIAVGLLLPGVNIKSQFEATASDALKMQVTVGGRALLRFFPSLRIVVTDIHARKEGADIAAIAEAELGIELLPLLHNQVRIKEIVLRHPQITLERTRNGKFNFYTPAKVQRSVPATSLGGVSLEHATLRYANRQSGKVFEARECKVEGNPVQLAQGSSAQVMKNLSFKAKLACGQMRNDEFTASDVKLSVHGKSGILELQPVTMRLLGGKGSGTLRADFSGAVPSYQLDYSVAQFRADELFRSLSSQHVAEGFLDFSAKLSMQGFDAAEMTRTAQGEASVRGENLQLYIGDLDDKLSRYESSQTFNLVDLGAFFLAGPLGPLVTKGYNFANVFMGSEGVTAVPTLVSNWKVEQGVAQAQDVAMTTRRSRLALQGGLDFVNHRFVDVTVALLDDKGCARIEQKVAGSFRKPEVAKPNVLISLAGPVRKLVAQAKDMLGAQCKVFYSGSVAPLHDVSDKK